MYIVANSGEAVGFSIVVEERPSAGDQSMVYGATPPDTVGAPPISTISPGKIDISSPASTTRGSYISTVTVMVSSSVLPIASSTTTLYSVVVSGIAIGLAMPGNARLAGGYQKYV